MMNVVKAMETLQQLDIKRGWAESPGGWTMNSLFFVASLLGWKREDIPAAAYELLGSVDASQMPAGDTWAILHSQAHTLIVDVSEAARGHKQPHLLAARMAGLQKLVLKQSTQMGEAGSLRLELVLAAFSKYRRCPIIDLSEHYEVPAAIHLMANSSVDQRIKSMHINGAAIPFVPSSVQQLTLHPCMIDWSVLGEVAPELPALRTLTIEARHVRLKASELCELATAFEARSPLYNELIIKSVDDEIGDAMRNMVEAYICARNGGLKVTWSK